MGLDSNFRTRLGAYHIGTMQLVDKDTPYVAWKHAHTLLLIVDNILPEFSFLSNYTMFLWI